MECGAILMEGVEWSSIDGVSINEEADFMANLFSSPEMCNLSLSNSFYSGNVDTVGCDSSSYYTTETDSNLYSLSQGSSYSGNNYCLSDNSDQFFAVNNGGSLPVEFCLDTKGVVQGVFPGNMLERSYGSGLEMSCDNLNDPETLVTKHEMVEIEPVEEEKSSDSSEVGRKKPQHSEVQKGKRNTRSKRSRKIVSDDEENSLSLKKQNSGNCGSEEDLSGENSNVPTVKTRANRGSATDPQSLYARKRRERINERLRILQNLVPNGTKVDMSTMLEEAVSYVKFLQLQIKLLSSDDLWMYAPLAYNGMDIGLDAKLNSLL